jgi:hypothetical protein
MNVPGYITIAPAYGSTSMPLPTPVGKQREVLYLPGRGTFAVLGTSGSGKTTLVILRSAYLADKQTPGNGPTLLVTFNRALVAYLRHRSHAQLRQDQRSSQVSERRSALVVAPGAAVLPPNRTICPRAWS